MKMRTWDISPKLAALKKDDFLKYWKETKGEAKTGKKADEAHEMLKKEAARLKK